MATNTNSRTTYEGLTTITRMAKCNCGNANCPALQKGEIAHRFIVKGTAKYIRTTCYEGNKFVEVNDFSEYDARHTIDHDVKITTENKEKAFIKFLQGFAISVGFGKNKGKYYCKALDNKTCYSTGHFVSENDDELRFFVNGKEVKTLEQFRKATH